MSCDTSSDPSPHGTTTLVLPKHTVTFMSVRRYSLCDGPIKTLKQRNKYWYKCLTHINFSINFFLNVVTLSTHMRGHFRVLSRSKRSEGLLTHIYVRATVFCFGPPGFYRTGHNGVREKKIEPCNCFQFWIKLHDFRFVKIGPVNMAKHGLPVLAITYFPWGQKLLRYRPDRPILNQNL